MTATAVRPRPPEVGNPRAQQDVRRTLLALLASAMGVLPLSELITDTGWLIDVWATMIVVIAPAAILRFRRPPSAGQIWIGLLLVIPWLTLRFVHIHAYGGIIPSGRTLHDLGQLMSDLHQTTTVQAAPVHSTPAIKLALCLLLGLVAALVDLTAVVGRRGALAGVPLLVVFTVSGAVPRHPVSWWLFAVAAGGFLILLALDSSDDLHRWGHFVPRTTPVTTRTAATGQRVAIVAIALAVVLPAFLPSDSRNLLANLFHSGVGSSGLDTGFGRGGGSNGIDPFVALQGQLNRKSPENLFDVTVHSRLGGQAGQQADASLFYARANVLSRYTGTGWAAGDPGGTESVSSTRFESAPGQQFPPVSRVYSVHVADTDLTSNPPIFAVPREVDGLDAKAAWNPQDQLLVDTHIEPGDQYDMTVTQPAPTVALLRAASGTDPAMNAWLTQPDVPQSVHTLVDRLTADAQTPYDRARALSDYFTTPSNGFVYSLSTRTGDSGNALVDFLQTKSGYCQQYAAAMGVMLRLAGIPSRVVLGYTHPLPSNGTFTVTTNDAHAWDEAYFAGVGWIPFDPTPIAGIPGGATTNLPWAPHPDQQQNDPGVKPTIHRSSAPGGASTSASTAVPVASAPTNGNVAGALLATGVIVLLGVLILIPWAFRQARRRRRLQRARHGDTDALWAELSDTATDLGYLWSPARTPRQVAQWLTVPAGSASGSLQHMASTVEQIRYAPDGTATDGSTLVADLTAVQTGLRAGRPRGERVRAALLPASLNWRLVGWLRRESGARRKR